jgi:hypothetical protein
MMAAFRTVGEDERRLLDAGPGYPCHGSLKL